MKNINTIITICITIAFICFNTQLKAQSDTIKYNVELFNVSSLGDYSPFWLHSNTYGLSSQKPNSMYFNAGLSKNMQHSDRLFDYEFKVNASLNTDYSKISVLLQEYYINTRLSVFGLRIGAQEEHYGNQDSTLSSGGLLFSKNSRPMPKIWIGIENFQAIPFSAGYIELKGGISNAWMLDNTYIQKAMMHHKYAYLKVGGKFPVNLQYGLDHVAQWGGISPDYGAQPSSLSDFKRIFLAQSGSNDAANVDQINTLGNHIISQSMKVEVKLSDYKINAYWQNISEDGPVRYLWNSMNRSDGLWGISIKSNKFPYVQGLLYEYLNTTDQSGPYHDKDGIVYGGNDSYFKNTVYKSGWNYYSRTIGTPLILSPMYNTDAAIQTENNRIQAHHFGIEGKFGITNYRALATFSKSYGTYSSPTYPAKTLNSFLIEISRLVPQTNGIEGTVHLAGDYGSFYGNSFGLMIGIRKRGDLFNY